jgi:hypothetical protein
MISAGIIALRRHRLGRGQPGPHYDQAGSSSTSASSLLGIALVEPIGDGPSRRSPSNWSARFPPRSSARVRAHPAGCVRADLLDLVERAQYPPPSLAIRQATDRYSSLSVESGEEEDLPVVFVFVFVFVFDDRQRQAELALDLLSLVNAATPWVENSTSVPARCSGSMSSESSPWTIRRTSILAAAGQSVSKLNSALVGLGRIHVQDRLGRYPQILAQRLNTALLFADAFEAS